jgi:hypothetical protein
MGSGMGYLTFACHQCFSTDTPLLSNKEAKNIIQTRTVNTIGVETRLSLVEKTNKIVQNLQIKGLEFIQGNIDTFSLEKDECDILIALHACDTATDDAIMKGIHACVPIIVVAPCCHKEARKYIDNQYKQKVLKVIQQKMRIIHCNQLCLMGYTEKDCVKSLQIFLEL